jgi:hypothetical protein
MTTIDKIHFGEDTYEMDDIIDIYVGADDSTPPEPMIVVCSKSSGRKLYPMTLENRLSFNKWTGLQLEIGIIQEKSRDLKFKR